MTHESQASDFSSNDLASNLKSAMRRMPASVALITTYDPAARSPSGLAATAVIPVSMDPPSMLVAVNRAASAHNVMRTAGLYSINLLGAEHASLIEAFSGSEGRDRRFEDEAWAFHDGLPYLPAACSSIFCNVRSEVEFGSHSLFVGEVFRITTGSSRSTEPMIWFDGKLATLAT